jgi:hypothetical protein
VITPPRPAPSSQERGVLSKILYATIAGSFEELMVKIASEAKDRGPGPMPTAEALGNSLVTLAETANDIIVWNVRTEATWQKLRDCGKKLRCGVDWLSWYLTINSLDKHDVTRTEDVREG